MKYSETIYNSIMTGHITSQTYIKIQGLLSTMKILIVEIQIAVIYI